LAAHLAVLDEVLRVSRGLIDLGEIPLAAIAALEAAARF